MPSSLANPFFNCDVITLTNAKNNDHPGSTSGPQQHHYFSDRKKLVHHCTIFLCSLVVGNTDDTDDQCRGPSIKDKDHLVGLLTKKNIHNVLLLLLFHMNSSSSWFRGRPLKGPGLCGRRPPLLHNQFISAALHTHKHQTDNPTILVTILRIY